MTEEPKKPQLRSLKSLIQRSTKSLKNITSKRINIFKKFLQDITFDKFLEKLKIDPKLREEETMHFIKAFMEEKNMLEILIKNKTQEIDKTALLDCFSRFMEIQTAQINEILFHMGDNADRFYIILKGGVEISVPEKKKLWLSRLEYFKYLEKTLYEEEIGLVKLILNSNYEKISFENYEDFYEYAKAKAKITLMEKLKTISDEKLLEDFSKKNSFIYKIFKFADDLNFLNYFSEDKNNSGSTRSNENSVSQQDEFNSESDDNNEEDSKSESNNFKLNEDRKDSNPRLKLSNNNFLMLTANHQPSKLKKNLKISNIDNNEFIPLNDESDFTKNEDFSDNNNCNLNSANNIINVFGEKKRSESSDSVLKLKNNLESKNKKLETLYQVFELTIKELEILKKYSLMENDAYKLKYYLISTKILCLREKEYFGDYALEDKNKKRTATVKCSENTILGFIKTEVYNENIYNRNQKNNFKNMQMLNDISFFKDISLANFQTFCSHKFELKNFVKKETLIESNTQSSELLIIKEGKADVTLNANVFDLQNIIDEIVNNFPFKNNNLTLENKQFLKALKQKKIDENCFNQKQKDNLLIRKNVNLFSLEKSGLIGMEAPFLKMKSFYKVIPVSEKLCVYALSEENLDKIFTQYPDCRNSYDKLALRKCLMVLTRLNEIKNSILKLSNLKFNNLAMNNYFVDNDPLNKKLSSSMEKFNSNKISKYATSGNLPNIRLSIINEDTKEFYKNDPSIEIVENLNKRIINRNTSHFTNQSNKKCSNLQNTSIQKDQSKLLNSNTKDSASKNDIKPDILNKVLFDQQINKTQILNFNNNILTRKSEMDKDEYYSLGTNFNPQNTCKTRFKSFHSNISKSSSSLPFISPSFITTVIAEKIQSRINPIKLGNDKLNLEENKVQSVKENPLTEKIKTSKDFKVINKDNQSINSIFYGSTGSRFFQSSINLKSPYNNNSSNYNQDKKECLKSQEFIDNNNPNPSATDNHEDDIEENLFSFNKKLNKKTNRKLSFNNSSVNANKIESYNYKSDKDKNVTSIFSNYSNLNENNKLSFINESKRGFRKNSEEGFNELIKTHGNFKNFKKPDGNEACNINVYNFLNIYNYRVGISHKEKLSLPKNRIKSVDYKNDNLSPTKDDNFPDNVNNDLNNINQNNVNTLNDDNNNCQNIDIAKPVVFNKTIMNINKNGKILTESNNLSKSNDSNEKNGKQESFNNKPLAIKIFDDVEFDNKIPKTQTFKDTLVNIQNLRKKIKISSVKKIMLSKN